MQNQHNTMKTCVIRKGHGLLVAGDRALVTVDIECNYKTIDGDVKNIEKRERVEMKLGSIMKLCSIILDDIIATMREGEVCRLASVPCDDDMMLEHSLPPETHLEYIITLHSFQRARQVWEMNDSELLTLVSEYKDKGTELYKDEDIKEASISYSKAIKMITAVSEQEKIKELQMTLLLNLAACQLKLGLNSYVYDNCTHVLSVQPQCIKALYRRGVAALALGDLTTAEHDLREAERIEPQNVAIQKKLRQVIKLTHQQTTSLSHALKPMFASKS